MPDDILRIVYYLKITFINGGTTYYRGPRIQHNMEQVFPDRESYRAFTEDLREGELLIEIECKSNKSFVLNMEFMQAVIKNPGQPNQEIMKEGVVELIKEFTEKGTEFLLNLH